VSFKDHVRDIAAAVARDDEVAASGHLFLALHRLAPGTVIDIVTQLTAELLPQFRDGAGWFEGLEEELRRVDEVAQDPNPERDVSLDAWYMPTSLVLPVADGHFRAAIAGLLDAVDGRRFPEMITSAATGSILETLSARVMVVWREADPDGYQEQNERFKAHVFGWIQVGFEAGMEPVDPPEVTTERKRGWRDLLSRLEDLARQSPPEVNDDPGGARALERWRKHGGVLYPPRETADDC
jgi:hypothetical protein